MDSLNFWGQGPLEGLNLKQNQWLQKIPKDTPIHPTKCSCLSCSQVTVSGFLLKRAKPICHTHPAVQAGCALRGSSKAGNPQERLLKLSDSGDSQPAKAKDYCKLFRLAWNFKRFFPPNISLFGVAWNFQTVCFSPCLVSGLNQIEIFFPAPEIWGWSVRASKWSGRVQWRWGTEPGRAHTWSSIRWSKANSNSDVKNAEAATHQEGSHHSHHRVAGASDFGFPAKIQGGFVFFWCKLGWTTMQWEKYPSVLVILVLSLDLINLWSDQLHDSTRSWSFSTTMTANQGISRKSKKQT